MENGKKKYGKYGNKKDITKSRTFSLQIMKMKYCAGNKITLGLSSKLKK